MPLKCVRLYTNAKQSSYLMFTINLWYMYCTHIKAGKIKVTLSSNTASKWRSQGYKPSLHDFKVLVRCLIPLSNLHEPTFQKNNTFRQKKNCKWVIKDTFTWSWIRSLREYFYFGCFCFLHEHRASRCIHFSHVKCPSPSQPLHVEW